MTVASKMIKRSRKVARAAMVEFGPEEPDVGRRMTAIVIYDYMYDNATYICRSVLACPVHEFIYTNDVTSYANWILITSTILMIILISYLLFLLVVLFSKK